MASIVEICNMSLSHLGSSKEIASLTERSQEAAACNRFYSTALKATIRDFGWSFSTKFSKVPLIKSQPTPEWAYSYRVPSDSLKVRRIVSGIVPETEASRIAFVLAEDEAGGIILTNQPDAEIEYTFRADDPARYPPDFVLALSYRLAAYIAPRITAGDPNRLGDKAARSYLFELGIARTNSVMEQSPVEDPDSEFVRARG